MSTHAVYRLLHLSFQEVMLKDKIMCHSMFEVPNADIPRNEVCATGIKGSVLAQLSKTFFHAFAFVRCWFKSPSSAWPTLANHH